jgi:hypothetical protein
MKLFVALIATLPLLAQRETGGIPLISFAGSGQDSIQAMASDSQGNVYVAGTTSSIDFPVTSAAWQPKIAEARALRSTDGGATWVKLANPPADLLTIQPDPVNPLTLFAASAGAIYKSADGGATWRTVHSGMQAVSGVNPNLVVDPGNARRVAAMSASQLITSLDGGETWMADPSPSPAGCSQLVVDPTGSGAIALGCSNGIYRRAIGAPRLNLSDRRRRAEAARSRLSTLFTRAGSTPRRNREARVSSF